MLICSIPISKADGYVKEQSIDDPGLVARFVAAEDRPGWGVYFCPNTLVEGARTRSLDTVKQIDRLFSDLDFKDIAETPAEVLKGVSQLPAPPTTIRNSGGGLHVYYELNEPIGRDDPDYEHTVALYKRLAHVLCGDPAPAHPAALMRYPGTHNWKRDEPILCEDVGGCGKAHDIADIEAMLDLLGDTPIFTRKPRSNGHDKTAAPGPQSDGPVDVEARLAAMQHKGVGDSAVHWTQLQCTASLLRAGCTVDHVVSEVLDATRKCVAGNSDADKWDWGGRKGGEEHTIREMCFGLINKTPELSPMLPDSLRPKFEADVAAGRKTKIVHAPHIGWHVRSWGERARQQGDDAAPGASNEAAAGRKRSAAEFVLHPFVPFDLAALPPRQWLYGRHYQRGVVSATIAPGGSARPPWTLLSSWRWRLAATC